MSSSLRSKAIYLFGWRWGHFPVPATFLAAAARSGGPGRRVAPAPWRLALAGREHRGRLTVGGRRLHSMLAAGVMLVIVAIGGQEAGAQPMDRVDAAPPTALRADSAASVDAAIASAAQRFGLPPAWIRAVMRAESAFEPRALSHAGAMGLMQLMPATWAEWRGRLGLGADPFDVSDNVMAGAGYMRELFDRFGSPGFLAAYNAGPQRYADHLAGVGGLPAETRAYITRVAPHLDAGAVAPSAARAPDWRASSLFAGARPPSGTPSDGGLFVRPSSGSDRR
ncbi:lytic transglycosylase domain-containing protein [Phenylobacterium sp.]|uniref:lytic transglycosylase domain-containing protein n=1 Tax=Phenylobacterium sp. TaxID=1871053 RepID=UPI003D291D6D